MNQLEEADSPRLEYSFALAVGGLVLFAGIWPMVLAECGKAFPAWLTLLLTVIPIQMANIASCVIPAWRYCPEKPLAQVLELKLPASNDGVRILSGTLAIYLVSAVATAITVSLLQKVGIPAREQPALEILRNGPPLLAGILIPAAVILAPAGEELCFRYAVYRKLEIQLGSRYAAGLTAFIFAAVHLNLQVFPALFLLSLWLSALYRKTGSLLAPMIAHALFNAMTILLLYLTLSIK